MNRKNVFVLTIGVIVLALIIFTSLFRVITDWFWFQEIKHTPLFTTPLVTKLLLGFGSGIFAFLFFYIVLTLARRSSPNQGKTINLRINTLKGPRIRTIESSKLVKKIIIPTILFISVIIGLIGSAQWEVVLTYLNATPFNSTDSLFGRDISYYFFTLPFIQTVIGFATAIIVITLIGSLLLFLTLGAIELRAGWTRALKNGGTMLSAARKHLSILLAFLFIIISFKAYFVQIPNLLYSTTGPFTGASFTDVKISLPVLQISAVLAMVVAVVLIMNAFKSNIRLFIGSLIIYFLVLIVGGWVTPLIVQKFIVLPNELAKETPYIEHNIAATQKAYGIDDVDKRDLEGETSLTMADINNNQSTIQNIRLWDREPLLDTFGQLQEIRTYYDFISLDNDRYTINDELRQVLLSPRELNVASLPQRNFINEHLTFTHGFGLTLGPVNEVSPEGLPVLFLQDLPPKSTIESLGVTRPEIYYGELANEYVVVNTKAKEFNYPSGEENVFAEYEGDGGVPIKSLIRKVLFALRFQSLKILFSQDITAESRIMFYRDIDQRVRKAAPFLRFDKDPYLVLTEDGEFKWIYDSYTASDRFPYAERASDARLRDFVPNTPFPVGQVNYIRNAVKIVVDAYTGKMDLYITDPNDPIIKTYAKIFKDTFKSFEEMPDDLKSHIRYPEDLFAFQTNVYSVYHMEEPQIFYNKEDQWQIPTKPGMETTDPMMRHMIMKLPEEEKEEFILMLPFTPKGKDNLSAWMVARNDGEHYGQLVVYRFPKQKLVFGPRQIINRINQDPEISRQVSLWDQRGSEVISGNLLVIPIEKSLLYVQPIYLRAEGGKIPELKRVIVAYENKIAMEETLDEALSSLFAGTKVETAAEEPAETAPQAPQTTPESDLITQAKETYQRAMEAQKKGDWATYGNEIEELGKLLEQLVKE